MDWVFNYNLRFMDSPLEKMYECKEEEEEVEQSQSPFDLEKA